MATRTVQPKQTVAGIAQTNNISEDQFYLANPGVKTLRPGQVVNVPKPATFQFTTQAGGGTFQPGTPASRFNPLGSPATSTSSGFQTPTTNGFTAANSNGAVFSYAPAGNNSYGSLNTPGYTNLTPSQSQNIPPSAGNTNLTPSQSQNIPTAQTSVSNVPAKPAGTYTGDPNDPNTAAWKAYWNYSAENPSTTQTQGDAPRVMSRSEIWNMKADSRRKKMAKSAGDDQTGNGGGGFSPAMPTAQPELVRSIVWGI